MSKRSSLPASTPWHSRQMQERSHLGFTAKKTNNPGLSKCWHCCPILPIGSSHLAKGFGKVLERITWPFFFFLFYLNPSPCPSAKVEKENEGRRKSPSSLFGQNTSRI
jgi:hypothetical protein